MIDKKFVMRSTSSASLHQYAAGCFLSWNDYQWSGPGRWRGICISLTQGCGCESELGSRVNPGGRKNRWNANNLIDISLNKTPIPVALIVLVSLALELRHGGRDQGVCGLGSIITALSAAGARAGHLSWPLLMSVMREREVLSPPSSHHQAWPRVQSETDLCVTRIPEIHSLNEWDTLIESRIGTRYISFLSS